MKPSVLIPLLLLASYHREEIDVPVVADFGYEVVDNDYSIPVKIAAVNKAPERWAPGSGWKHNKKVLT